MSRIDAIVATQVADVSRPLQSGQERSQQTQAAQVANLGKTSSPVSADELRAAAAQIKQVVETASNRRLAFEIDHDSGDMYVQVRDQTSGEVIQQIPTEAIMRMHQRLEELVGKFLNEEA
jgi:uncharacterized FlaG/YvyC family protein